jgi:hypothetical protein
MNEQSTLASVENPPAPPKDKRWPIKLIGAGVAGVVYGLLARLIFGAHFTNAILTTMSNGFLVLVPLAVGALTVYFAPRHLRTSWPYALFVPWLPGSVFLVVVTLLAWEVFFCVIMAAPIFLFANSIGGVLMCLVLNLTKPKSGVQESIRTVPTQITIHASEDAIWQNIIRVPKITDTEQHFSIHHLMGVPRPVEATLSQEGIGGVRHATFDDGLAFVEIITAWEDHKTLSFSIKVDTSSVLNPPFDAVGGKYFDVLAATYVMEPLGNGDVILHLSSTERVTTSLNFYSGLWTDLVMRDLQNYILEIIKQRAEAVAPR